MADHVGSPSHDARYSEVRRSMFNVYQSQQKHAYGHSVSRNCLAVTSLRHHRTIFFVALPNIPSFDYVQNTAAAEFEDNNRTGSESVGCHAQFISMLL